MASAESEHDHGAPRPRTARHASVVTGAYAGLFAVVCALGARFVPTLHGGRLDAGVHGRSAVVALVLLGLAFAVAELLPIGFTFGGNSFTFTPNEIPLVVGALTVPGPILLVARFAGSLVALAVRQGNRPTKLAFNVWFLELQALCFVLVVGFAPQPLSLGWQTWPWVLLALVAKELVTQVVMVDVLTRLGTFINARAVARSGIIQVGTTTLLTALSLVGLRLAQTAPADLILFAGVVAGCVLTYRSQLKAQARFARTSQLYDFARLVAQTAARTDEVPRLASKIGEVLSSHRVEVILLPDGIDQPLVRYSGDARTVAREDLPGTDALPALWSGVLGSSTTIVLPAVDGLPAAVVAPLASDGTVAGHVAVLGHAGERATFDLNDGQMLETMASHLSSWLENGRLIEQLRREIAVREHQALHDSLTDLPNRRLFQERSSMAILDAQRQGHTGAVFLFDLDDFKEINDALGHRAGDVVLAHVADRVLRALPDGATLARLGGDEFAVLLPFVDGVAQAEDIGRRTLDAVAEPLEIEELRLTAAASLGLTLFPRDGDDASTLLQRADVAMYAAKTRHTGVERYNAEDDRSSSRRLQLATDLRDAIEAGDIVLYLQPKLDLQTGRILGAEALSRWTHATWGLVPPDEFIPIAEQTGSIGRLTLSVLEQGIAALAALHAQDPTLSISMNLSMRNLLDEDLPNQVARILGEWGVPAHLVTLEITESCIMTDPVRALRVFAHLDEIGVRMSIDDFGTGQSSFAYLRELPVDEVKIDKSFVKRMLESGPDEAIVRSVIDLGRNLDLSVVAEGVEQAEVLDRLRAMGCDEAQGFFVARPMPAAAFSSWLRQRSAAPAPVPHPASPRR